MKRILYCTTGLILSGMLAACATTSGSRDLAGKGGSNSGAGGSRAPSEPAPRSEAAPRSQGTVMSSHPSKPSVTVHDSGSNKPATVTVNHPAPNKGHQVIIHNPTANNGNGRNESHPVIVDTRHPSVQSHDSHTRVMVRNNSFRPQHDWGHFHPVIITGYQYAWWGVWGINDWNTVGTVTCEATNETTAELYPVTMERDGNGWDDGAINNIEDQALEDCMSEVQTNPDGTVQTCGPITPSACSFEMWDGHTLYIPN